MLIAFNGYGCTSLVFQLTDIFGYSETPLNGHSSRMNTFTVMDSCKSAKRFSIDFNNIIILETPEQQTPCHSRWTCAIENYPTWWTVSHTRKENWRVICISAVLCRIHPKGEPVWYPFKSHKGSKPQFLPSVIAICSLVPSQTTTIRKRCGL